MDFKPAAIYAACLPFILILVLPITTYLGNYEDSTVNLKDVLLFLAPLSCVLAFILWAFLLAAYHFTLFYKILSGLLVGLALSFWVQSQLFCWDFGLLDGRQINWNLGGTQVKIEWLCWFIILIVAIVQSVKSQKILFLEAQGILLLGFLTVFSAWFFSEYRTKENYTTPQKNLFSFHQVNNKILIVLDTFQSDIFDEIAQRWPDEIEYLQGFSFYPNAVSGYPTTKPSIPLITTGKFYKNEIPHRQWILANNQSQNIADYFVRQGYGVNLASFIPQTLDGIKANKIRLSYFAETNSLGVNRNQLLVLDGGLFRAFPLEWKSFVYNQGRWLFYSIATKENELASTLNADDLQFLTHLEKKIKIDSVAKGEFKFYHYAGVHPPSQVNENFKLEKEMPEGKDSYIRHARGVLLFLKRKLNLLKRVGIYDSAEILVVADHGLGYLPSDMNSVEPKDLIEDHVLGAARPLFLYKPAMANGKLRHSDAPVHLADIVCLLSQNSPDFGCKNSRLGEEMKPRRFLFYKWTHKYWDKDYLPSMTEYVIKGDVRQLSSWKNRYLEHSKGHSKDRLTYAFGNTVSFAENGNAKKYLREGWSYQEPTIRWSYGEQSRLFIKLQQTSNVPLLLRLYAAPPPMIQGKNLQNVKVSINGRKVADWQINAMGWYEAKIPQEIVKNGNLNIRFFTASPTAPCEISDSKDCRKLGFLASEMIILKNLPELG